MALLGGIRLVLFWLLSLAVALVSWRFLLLGVEASMGSIAHHVAARPLAFFAHIGLAPVALALLPFQFWHGLRRRRPALHRWIGRSYAMAILLSGTGGLALALGTTAGPVAALGFGLLAVVWLCTTATGVWRARARDFTAHRRWMIRSAALTLAAVTLRLYLPLSQIAGVDFDSAYAAIAWLCWVPNLLLAEVFLRRSQGRTSITLAA